ncbi:hypothetical protein GGR54DRAFT_655137 [Hypoxylon sp. NC1633]|nr:hypothetical protein GGR54DRAFT_655137 [Hypoxylon sp. NC1633]
MQNDEDHDTFEINPQAEIMALLGNNGCLRLPQRHKYFNFLGDKSASSRLSYHHTGRNLFTRPPPRDRVNAVDDFYKRFVNISGWNASHRIAEHSRTCLFLMCQTLSIALEEPERRVVILTHHSPTMDHRVFEAHFGQGFDDDNYLRASDMSIYLSWPMNNVRLWAFGGTHRNGDYSDQ